MVKNADDDHDVNAVEREVDVLRGRTQALMAALQERMDERRGQYEEICARTRELTDLERQLRRHPIAAGGLLSGLAVAGGLVLWRAIARERRERRWPRRLSRQTRALATLLAHPEQALHHDEPLLRRLFDAVALGVVGMVARSVSERLLSVHK